MYVLKGMLSRQNCGEIMTQNLCSKKETLMQPQEEDFQRLSTRDRSVIVRY